MMANGRHKKSNGEQQITSIQITTKTRDKLKKIGRMDEDWDTLLNRVAEEFVLFDFEFDKQIDELSKKYGISRKMIIMIGVAIFMFLASSGVIQQLTKSKSTSVAGLITEFIKYKLK